MIQNTPPTSTSALVLGVSEICRTWSCLCGPLESSGCPSFCKSNDSPSPILAPGCCVGSSLLVPASLAPLAGVDLRLTVQGVRVKGTASFTGLFGAGSQIGKPKPFISEVHTKVIKGKKENQTENIGSTDVVKLKKALFQVWREPSLSFHRGSCFSELFPKLVSSGPLLQGCTEVC